MHSDICIRQTSATTKALNASKHEEKDLFFADGENKTQVVLLNGKQMKIRTDISQSFDCHNYHKRNATNGKRYKTQLKEVDSYQKFAIKPKNLILPTIIHPQQVTIEHSKKQRKSVRIQKNRFQTAFKMKRPSFFSDLISKEVNQSSKILNLEQINSKNIFISHHIDKPSPSKKDYPINKKQLKKLILITSMSSSKPLVQLPNIPTNKSDLFSIRH